MKSEKTLFATFMAQLTIIFLSELASTLNRILSDGKIGFQVALRFIAISFITYVLIITKTPSPRLFGGVTTAMTFGVALLLIIDWILSGGIYWDRANIPNALIVLSGIAGFFYYFFIVKRVTK